MPFDRICGDWFLHTLCNRIKKDPSKRQRLWLNLPSEERPILDKALKMVSQ
jgi:hypothetical protein